MSKTYKPPIGVYNKNHDILSIKSSERFNSNAGKEECFIKHFADLSEFEQKKVLKNLKMEYCLILFDYFSNNDSINSKIEDFAREAFNLDLPVSKVVEIHLNLIDGVEKQLMVEGLNAEYLSDFRLTLIDVIAHLGELYRSAERI